MPFTIKHIFIEFRAFALIRKQFFDVNSLGDLFVNVHIDDLLSFLKEFWAKEYDEYHLNTMKKVKLTTSVEADLKALFSLRCRGGNYSIPWIAPLYPWSLPYNAECLARQHQVPFFLIFGMIWLEIELWSPRPLANTLLIRPFLI